MQVITTIKTSELWVALGCEEPVESTLTSVILDALVLSCSKGVSLFNATSRGKGVSFHVVMPHTVKLKKKNAGQPVLTIGHFHFPHRHQ